MRLIHYIEIENFKAFGDKTYIELDHPAVMIGPNNCGKTSVIQALALWSQAVKTWYEVRRISNAKERTSAPINRLNITAVPVQRTRFFWHDTRVRNANQDIPMSITVGVEYEGKIEAVPFRFRNQGEDMVYCTPLESVRDRIDLIAHAAAIPVELLYPMSGLEIEEPVLQPGRIGVLLGQGQTAQVLRNLCLRVQQDSADDWQKIVSWMRRLFHVEMGIPQQNSRGAVDLTYRQEGVKEALDISAAGRGFQQMLLVFAYLFYHKQSVLLIDEPDAHLEILRQKQIFVMLRDIASHSRSQVVMVTHSEVILEEALETNLTLLLEGQADNLAKKTEIRESLKVFGAEHYLRARERGYVLYLEGGTDISILRALAEKLRHPVVDIWDERINTFYITSNYPAVSAESELEKVEGGFGIPPRDHFYALRKLIPGLQGLAILDNDGRNPSDYDDAGAGLKIRYWKRYEVENYLITPEVLREFCNAKRQELGLFGPERHAVDEILNEAIGKWLFREEKRDFETWKSAPEDAAHLIWESKTRQIKMSAFAEDFFQRLAVRTDRTVLLTKGEFHLLTEWIDRQRIPDEVSSKLDLLQELFLKAK